MTGSEYQNLAMRTNDGLGIERIMNMADNLEQGVEDNVPDTGIDEEHAKKELGDVMWYVAMICESFGWSLDEIMQMNVDKLKKRYPEGFDTERANNRKPEDV